MTRLLLLLTVVQLAFAAGVCASAPRGAAAGAHDGRRGDHAALALPVGVETEAEEDGSRDERATPAVVAVEHLALCTLFDRLLDTHHSDRGVANRLDCSCARAPPAPAV